MSICLAHLIGSFYHVPGAFPPRDCGPYFLPQNLGVTVLTNGVWWKTSEGRS